MYEVAERTAVRFSSGKDVCAGWHYEGTNGGCVVMAGGFGVTKEPATDRFAERFHAAGYSVLAFDHRHLGESSGEPRQVVRITDQLADWAAALQYADSLPEVDAGKLVAWGFSLAGGHVIRVAARSAADGGVRLAAVIAQNPNLDGFVVTRNAGRHQRPTAMLRLMATAVRDQIGGLVGRAPILVPLVGPAGTVAVLSTPDGQRTDEVLNPGNRYPDWTQSIAARSVLAMPLYRPGRDAARVRCPLLIVASEHDQTVLPEPAVQAAAQAPLGELLQLAGDHYAPFTDGFEQTVQAQLAFLAHHLAP